MYKLEDTNADPKKPAIEEQLLEIVDEEEL